MSTEKALGEIVATLQAIDRRLDTLETAAKGAESRRVALSEVLGRNRGRLDLLSDRLATAIERIGERVGASEEENRALRARLDTLDVERHREQARRSVAARMGLAGFGAGVTGAALGLAPAMERVVLFFEALRAPP